VGFVRAVFRRRITCKPSGVSVAQYNSINVAILAQAIIAKERVGGNQVSKFIGTVAVRVGSVFAFLSAAFWRSGKPRILDASACASNNDPLAHP
jgi:hypothetical protein